MPEFIVHCCGCGLVLQEMGQSIERPLCPNCGSIRRQIDLTVAAQFSVHEQIRLKATDPSKPGKQKVKIEQLSGADFSREAGRFYKKARIIDRVNNRYFEVVSDPMTDQIIHSCEEPLSQHYGHGSAKPPPTLPEGPTPN